MTQPDIDQELERLLSVTRTGTEPDAGARARVRAALALGLTSAGVAQVGVATRTGLGLKLWLLSALSVALCLGVVLWLASPGPAPVAARAPARTSLPAAAPASVAPSPHAVSPAQSAPVPAPSDAAAVARLGPSKAPSAPKAEGSADELALVSSMQLALRSGNASQALARANEHARRFPAGSLAQEREGARAIARCQLAQPEGRAAILSAFEQRFASSPYAARVQAACAR